MKEELANEVAKSRRRFDEEAAQLRPELHRFCTRMTGSPIDGEDVLQDVLVRGFYQRSELRDAMSLRPWLFRIAHNRCIDFLRVRGRFVPLEVEREPDRDAESAMDEIERKHRVERALANLVIELPPKERACLILKDVLDCSLEETAEITESNVGAVKAALHRARVKLDEAGAEPRSARAIAPAQRALIERYLRAFNSRDWDRVRGLLTDTARLEVVDRTQGPFRDSCYFTNYGKLSWRWRLALARVDGVEAIVHFREVGGRWVPHAMLRLEFEGDKVALVRDYNHVAYLLHHCDVSAPEEESASPQRG